MKLLFQLAYVYKSVNAFAVVTCEIKFFQNYFNLRLRASEIIFISARGNLPEIILKLFWRLIAARWLRVK